MKVQFVTQPFLVNEKDLDRYNRDWTQFKTLQGWKWVSLLKITKILREYVLVRGLKKIHSDLYTNTEALF
jgi:hypothetical protein